MHHFALATMLLITSPPASAQSADECASDLATEMADAAARHDVKVDPDEVLTAQLPDGRRVATVGDTPTYLYFDVGSSTLDAGLYRLDDDNQRRAELMFYDPVDGLVPVPLEPQEFHTSLGDWMCENAPEILQNYCQTFVACAAYDLFCHY